MTMMMMMPITMTMMTMTVMVSDGDTDMHNGLDHSLSPITFADLKQLADRVALGTNIPIDLTTYAAMQSLGILMSMLPRYIHIHICAADCQRASHVATNWYHEWSFRVCCAGTHGTGLAHTHAHTQGLDLSWVGMSMGGGHRRQEYGGMEDTDVDKGYGGHGERGTKPWIWGGGRGERGQGHGYGVWYEYSLNQATATPTSHVLSVQSLETIRNAGLPPSEASELRRLILKLFTFPPAACIATPLDGKHRPDQGTFRYSTVMRWQWSIADLVEL